MMLQFAAGLVCRFVRVETTGHMIKRSPWSRGAFLVVLIVGVLGLSAEMSAQQAGQAPLPATTPIQNKVANDSGAAAGQPTTDPKVPQDDRILWTLPNYLTVENASSLPPLTAGQKFALITKDTFDPVYFAFIGLEAGVNQASNTNPTFGQGLKGYSQRYGLSICRQCDWKLYDQRGVSRGAAPRPALLPDGKGRVPTPCLVRRHQGFGYALGLGKSSVQLL